MCFLKTLKPLDTIPIERSHLSLESASQQNILYFENNHSFSKIIEHSKPPFKTSLKDQLLLNLLNLVNSNTQLLHDVDQKLASSDSTLNNCFQELDSMIDQSLLEKQDFQTCGSLEEATDPLIQTLFGKKKYEYKLELSEELPSTIYKERNIKISVMLKNKQNQTVLNSNIIHLCLGVCDSGGEWVSENKAKQNFMKGKTEVQIYHGEACFLKIYPREVSRTYAGGKLNFVVYAKSSTLQFTNNSSTIEKIVDSDLIEPLIIHDISIKAKKKQ